MTDLKVVCTDKKRHKELRIAAFRWDGGWFEAHRRIRYFGSDHERVEVALVSVTPPDGGPDPRRHAEGNLYRFPCRRCGRNTELGVDNLIKLFDGLRAATPAVETPIILDVSRLDF